MASVPRQDRPKPNVEQVVLVKIQRDALQQINQGPPPLHSNSSTETTDKEKAELFREGLSRAFTKPKSSIFWPTSTARNTVNSTLQSIVDLINLTLRTGKVPAAWKDARVTMLPKGKGASSDLSCYRPISVTCCLSKLVARLLNKKMYTLLKNNGFFVANFLCVNNMSKLKNGVLCVC